MHQIRVACHLDDIGNNDTENDAKSNVTALVRTRILQPAARTDLLQALNKCRNARILYHQTRHTYPDLVRTLHKLYHNLVAEAFRIADDHSIPDKTVWQGLEALEAGDSSWCDMKQVLEDAKRMDCGGKATPGIRRTRS